MLNKFFNRKTDTKDYQKLTWDPSATQALEQALNQAPVPTALKGTVKKQLAKAAENQAKQAGHDTVTAEDLMQGLLSKMPADMRAKVEQAAQKGPGAIKDLENELKK